MTFDPDVAAQIQQIRQRDRRPFKEVLNDLVRAGLAVRTAPSEPQGPCTRVVSLGKVLIPDLDDVSEVLAIIEGDDHR